MHILALKEIANGTEQFLGHMKVQSEALKIKSTKGENVKEACNLLDTAHETFESASTDMVSKIPEDWPKTPLEVMQTSSVTQFNRVFKDEEARARIEADQRGGEPEWPEHDEIINLALATHNRLKLTEKWDLHTRARS